MNRNNPKKLMEGKANVVQRDASHLHQVICFFIDKVDDDIDKQESINNVKYYCGDRKMNVNQVGYWCNNYYFWSKDYKKLMTNITEKNDSRKNNQQSPLLKLQHELFSKLKEHQKKVSKVSALFLRTQ